LDGDDKNDLLVSTSGAHPNTGEVIVCSGADGSPIDIIRGDDLGTRFGLCVTAIDDLNNDGYQDIVITATSVNDNSGSFHIYSGSDRALLGSYYHTANGVFLGSSLITEDVDGDGTQEVIVGAPGYDDGAGRVVVFSID
ncbi:MAG: FG-GAP repeat protein, partial [bacterium]